MLRAVIFDPVRNEQFTEENDELSKAHAYAECPKSWDSRKNVPSWVNVSYKDDDHDARGMSITFSQDLLADEGAATLNQK